MDKKMIAVIVILVVVIGIFLIVRSGDGVAEATNTALQVGGGGCGA